MSNIPDVHARNRTIPPGKVLLADRMPMGETFGKVHELDAKTIGRRCVRLIAVEAGWALAGACLRWDNGYYAVRWHETDGTIHGRRYSAFDEAHAHFSRMGAPMPSKTFNPPAQA